MAKAGRPKSVPHELPYEEAKFSPADVARLLGISPHTVRRLANAKKIGFLKPAGILRFRQSDVEAYLRDIEGHVGSKQLSEKAKRRFNLA